MADDTRSPGRPRQYGPRVSTAIRFDMDLHRRLESAAAERDLPLNLLVNRACEQFLDRLIPLDEMLLTGEVDRG